MGGDVPPYAPPPPPVTATLNPRLEGEVFFMTEPPVKKRLGRPPKPKDQLKKKTPDPMHDDPDRLRRILESIIPRDAPQSIEPAPEAPPVLSYPPAPSANKFTSTWSYETPLEQPPAGVELDSRVIQINGMPFQARSDCTYNFDYYGLIERIERCRKMMPEERKKNPLENELNIYRNLIQKDLWAMVYFVLKNPLANHPFIVQACREIQNENRNTLEVWARDHLKTTIISVGRQIQKVLNDPERRIAYFSATRPLAVKIVNVVRKVLESKFLVKSFPDILYEDPAREAFKWTDAPEGGLFLKRKGFYKEATFSAWGLVEGMPTGDHYTDLVCDDIVNQDHQSPEIIQKICDNFDMVENVGTRDVQITVVGTFYRHDDPLTYIRDKQDIETGERMFPMRKKAATIDGEFNGKSVFLPEETLQRKRSGKRYFFYCQQLLNPTPKGMEKLNRDHVIEVSRKDLPERLYKFMMIDGAGDEGKRKGPKEADAWAMAVIGVEPYRDELGASRVYILDLVIEKMDLVTAQQAAVDMYCRNGRILKLGIEKVGMSSTEIHICNALRAKKKIVSIEHGNLEILRPGGRTKAYRIESALAWPLKNGKIHILDTVPVAYRERLGLEMEKFPAWHDDGLDAVSYVYDIVKSYRFGERPDGEKPESSYDRAFRRAREHKNGRSGWIAV